MKTNQSFPGRLILIVTMFSGLLTGCGAVPGAAPAVTLVPTQNSATLVSEAVKTLAVQMTEQALLKPTDTQTPLPTATATLVPTATEVPSTPTQSASPTAAATQAPAVSAKALYAGTFPESKSEWMPNEKFGLALGFLNTGTVAWEPGYRLKLSGFQGEVTVQPEAELGKAIAPGEKVEFDLWAFGSETLGTHIWYFQLYTPSGGAVPGGAISFSYTSY